MQNTSFTKKTGEYTESNIFPQKVILLQLHITCEKSNLVIPTLSVTQKYRRL